MYKKKKSTVILVLTLILFTSFTVIFLQEKPVLYIIGDSTVRNGDGSGRNGQWGWGSFIANYFDTTRISIRNLARGGRSSRTFITEGLWDSILINLKKGDYVIIQFGHNDGGPLDDTARARGTIKGIGNDSLEIYNPIRKKQEVVHSYGWYLRKYIRDTKEKKAIPIVCSPIPRNQWQSGKIIRASEGYGRWAQQIAKSEEALFLDLNNMIADQYDNLGPDKVAGFFHGDHTHTNQKGALVNATLVIDGLTKFKNTSLKKFLITRR